MATAQESPIEDPSDRRDDRGRAWPFLGRGRGPFRSVAGYPGLVALLLYMATALYAQQHALGKLSTGCACNGWDPSLFIWSLKWWPYAITHGVNPFSTHLLWAPKVAFDTASNTTVPLPALVAWPVTALSSATVSYNLLMFVAPVLSGWCAYRLCRYVTGAPWASVVGGYVFGFSTFAIGESNSHMQLVFSFAAPLAVLLTLKRLDEKISARRYVVWLTLVLIAELLCGSEITLTMTIMGVVTLVAALIFGSRELRGRILHLLPSVAAAYVLMAVICSPYLYYLVTGPAVAVGRGNLFPADMLSFVVPTAVTAIGGHRFVGVSAQYLGNLSEDGTYVGVVIALIVIVFLVRRWHTALAKILAAVLVVAVVWSLGNYLYIDGHQTVALPWRLFHKLPLFDELVPVRIGEYIALLCAVVVTLWMSTPGHRTWWRWLVALLAVAMLFPNPNADYPGTHGPGNVFSGNYESLKFFTSGIYRRYLRPGEVVAPIPYAPTSPALVWQEQADMYFREASGNFYIPNSFGYDPMVQQLLNNVVNRQTPLLLRQFVAREHVKAFVVETDLAGFWVPYLKRLGLHPVGAGGVLVYNVPASWDSTPVPPLAIPPGCSPNAASCQPET